MGGGVRIVLPGIALAGVLLALPTGAARGQDDIGELKATAYIAVRVVGVPPSGLRAGGSVSYQVFVTNAGPSAVPSVQIEQRTSNLTLSTVNCACSVTRTSGEVTATTGALGVNQTVELEMTGQVIDAGRFSADVLAVAPRVIMPTPQKNAGSFSGEAGAAAQTPSINLSPIIWALLHPPPAQPQPQPSLPPKSDGQPPPYTQPEPSNQTSPKPQPQPAVQPQPYYTPPPPQPEPPPKPQTTLQRKPPRPRPTPLEPNLRLTVSPAPAAPYRTGQTISIAVIVTNIGGGPATDVSLDNVLSGLRIVNVDGDCQALSCGWARLDPGTSASLLLTAEVENSQQGFSDSVSTSASDLDTQTTTVSAAGVTNIWGYVAGGAAAALGSVGLAWVAVKAAQTLRRIRWRRRTTVTASLDPAGEVSSGSLNPRATFSMSARLEPGGAATRGPLPVRWISRP